jgi:LAO/AO transport system kinase
VIVILVPESGDSIQVMKAGLMEIADVFAVNKADRPEADKLVREIITMVGMSPHDESSWLMPVTKTEAVRDVGVEELIQTIEAHQKWLHSSGKKDVRLREFLKNEVEQILIEKLSQSVAAAFETKSGKELLDELIARKTDPYRAAEQLSQ